MVDRLLQEGANPNGLDGNYMPLIGSEASDSMANYPKMPINIGSDHDVSQ